MYFELSTRKREQGNEIRKSQRPQKQEHNQKIETTSSSRGPIVEKTDSMILSSEKSTTFGADKSKFDEWRQPRAFCAPADEPLLTVGSAPF